MSQQHPTLLVVFEGERFDVMSIRRWRDKLLARSDPPPTDG